MQLLPWTIFFPLNIYILWTFQTVRKENQSLYCDAELAHRRGHYSNNKTKNITALRKYLSLKFNVCPWAITNGRISVFSRQCKALSVLVVSFVFFFLPLLNRNRWELAGLYAPTAPRECPPAAPPLAVRADGEWKCPERRQAGGQKASRQTGNYSTSLRFFLFYVLFCFIVSEAATFRWFLIRGSGQGAESKNNKEEIG